MITETILHHWTGEIAAPLRLVDTRVKSEWIDEYQHLNMAHYLTICDQANWAFWNWVNHPAQSMDARDGHEYVIVENHVHYIGELPLDAPLYVTTQLTGLDDKRFILFHRVWDARDDSLAATNEVKSLGFNLKRRGIESWMAPVRARLDQILVAHEALGVPEQAGQGIALKRR
ncbi:MAG: hypothetical protein GY802_14385 [Gammaproteobacteria bacterium]|nr:hypothetical protein [Gammaproteobacteria bacterium]